MIKQQTLRPTVVLPDTTPLILLAAGDALHVLTDLGRVVVVDVVALEATYFRDKPYAPQIADWLAAGQAAGSNTPIDVAESELGPLYRLALEQGLKKPRHLGELAMMEWLVDRLDQIGGPALVVYEDGKVPAMLARQGMAAEVAAATTRNLLTLAEEAGLCCERGSVVEQDHRCGADREPCLGPDRHQTGDAMKSLVHPILRRYADGEISALRAAAEFGDHATVADVVMMMKAAGLQPPRQTPEQETTELARAPSFARPRSAAGVISAVAQNLTRQFTPMKLEETAAG